MVDLSETWRQLQLKEKPEEVAVDVVQVVVVVLLDLEVVDGANVRRKKMGTPDGRVAPKSWT